MLSALVSRWYESLAGTLQVNFAAIWVSLLGCYGRPITSHATLPRGRAAPVRRSKCADVVTERRGPWIMPTCAVAGD